MHSQSVKSWATSLSAASLVLAALLTACGSPPPPPVDPSYEAQLPSDPTLLAPANVALDRVSNVVVEPDETTLPSDRLANLREHQASDVIRRAVMAELGQRGRLDVHSPYWLSIRVTAFRLRSTAVTVWVGSMSGNDNISATTAVMRGAEQQGTHDAHVASMKGGVFSPSSHGRLNNLAGALAREVADLTFGER